MDTRVRRAINVLANGGIVAYPTDTVYGLGAHTDCPDAVMKVYDVKRRSRHLPLPLLLSNTSQITTVARDVPDVAWALAERFLPGGLTLVLFKAPTVSSLVTGGSDKVAVRVPDHPVPIVIIDGLGAPITGTSANRSGKPSPLTAQEVHRQLGHQVDLIIDGVCPGGMDSSVVDLTEEIPRILREGAVRREDIERECGTSVC
ncbi:MAG: L-threonylcarbamoyladenylate synthase [Chloroflexota bacterium]